MADIGVFAGKGIWMGQYDLSGKLNAAGIAHEAEALDNTVVSDTTRSEAGGLKTVRFEGAGLFDGDDDTALQTNMVTANVPISFGVEGILVGDVAYAFEAHQASYQMGGPLGELLRYNISANSQGSPLIRGHIMAIGAKVAEASGAALELGAVTATQTMYVFTHCTAATGAGDLTVILESDTAEGFPSTTTRVTSVVTSAPGYDVSSADGPVTDTWWRVSWSFGGTLSAATILVVAGWY